MGKSGVFWTNNKRKQKTHVNPKDSNIYNKEKPATHTTPLGVE